jgi:6,7-dimethyl-8-ribityllumazine synthase
MRHDIRTIIGKQEAPFSIALVVSQFNETITSALKHGAIERLLELGFSENDLLVVEVPGAVEIPFAAQLLAKKQQVDVIIALGAVIRGDTSHYDYVCDQVSQGCQRVMLDNQIPVIFGVLTTDNEEQALERVGGSHGHKGRDAADCAMTMYSIAKQID